MYIRIWKQCTIYSYMVEPGVTSIRTSCLIDRCERFGVYTYYYFKTQEALCTPVVLQITTYMAVFTAVLEFVSIALSLVCSETFPLWRAKENISFVFILTKKESVCLLYFIYVVTELCYMKIKLQSFLTVRQTECQVHCGMEFFYLKWTTPPHTTATEVRRFFLHLRESNFKRALFCLTEKFMLLILPVIGLKKYILMQLL